MEFQLLTYILYGLFILSCVILIVVILLQPGKADAGALFSNTLSSTAFGPRGTASLLAKITIGAAAAFMLIALMLGLGVFTGTRSVLQSQPAAPTSTPTPVPATSPAAPASTAPSSTAPAGSAAPAGSSAPAKAPAASPAASKSK